MFSLLYSTPRPDFTELAPYMEGLSEKQRVLFLSTYSHLHTNSALPKDKAIQHAMMIVMKYKYDHLIYSPEQESQLTHLVKA